MYIMFYRGEFCAKLESSMESKNSNCDYAEIGPELMSSVRFHSFGGGTSSHYSEINDFAIQSTLCASESTARAEGKGQSVREFTSKQNPYDEPDSTKFVKRPAPSIPPTSTPPETALLCRNYSRLERTPFYVPAELNTTSGEETVTPSHHHYHTLEQSRNGKPLLYSDGAEQSGSSDLYTGNVLPNGHHLPTILEHPYHILEQSDTLFDDQETRIYNNYVLDGATQGYRQDKYEYDRLVDPQLYNMLDRSSTNPGLSKIYDVKSGPYSKLDTLTPQYKHRSISSSGTELELSTEIFDDMQYITSPVPTPRSADSCREMGVSVGMEMQLGDVGTSKYNGDYERDPIYMENIKTPDKFKTSSLPNIYQPLEVTAMDPTTDYEKYLPRPASSGNNTRAV